MCMNLRKKRVFLLNFDHFGFDPTDPANIAKCLKLQARSLFLMKPGDAIVVSQPISAAFLEYFVERMGFCPIVYWVKRSVFERLDMLQDILNDDGLITELQRHSSSVGGGAYLTPLMQHELVYEISKETGLPVLGTSLEDIENGVVRDGNDKAFFDRYCTQNGLKTPTTHVCRTIADIQDAGTQVFASGGQLSLRNTKGAGGLGNVVIEDDSHLLGLVRQLIATEISMLAGPCIPDLIHGAITIDVTDDDVSFVAAFYRRVTDEHESVGGRLPYAQDLSEIADEIAAALRYAESRRKAGYRGRLDLDFGQNLDGTWWFESNGRVLLTDVSLNVRDRCAELWEYDTDSIVVEYDEDPPYGDHTFTLEELKLHAAEAVRSVRESPLIARETPERHLELFIISPPEASDKGWFSFAAAGANFRLAEALRFKFHRLLESGPPKKGTAPSQPRV